MTIILPSFRLEKFNENKKEHLNMVKSFDNDELVKKYLFPNSESFYNLIESSFDSPTIFNTFYVIYYENKVIGYIEIENQLNTYLNYAILKEERHKGYAARLLKELSEYLLKLDYVKTVNTIIRKENKYSINASINGGFIYTGDNTTNFDVYRKSK